MPKSLSSQQNSTGIRSPWCTLYSAAFNAPRAVEWLSEASPNEQTTIASAGHAGLTPIRCARSIANPTPIARGRWDAIVEV